jgi:hypothetical protein
MYSGLIKYFPLALAEVAKLSAEGNRQHKIGDGKCPVWDRSKSPDELDALVRHLVDEDWTAVAWRALANLQKHLEATSPGIKASPSNDRVQDFGQCKHPPQEPCQCAPLPDHIPSILAEFLASEGALEAFIENDDKDGWELKVPSEWVEDAFLWVMTDDGITYWDNINDSWQAVCRELDNI